MNQTEMLKRLEWSGKFWDALVRLPSPHCPECDRVPELGHTETCELNRLINQPRTDVEQLKAGDAVARAVWDWLLRAETIDLVPWCEDEIKIAKMVTRKMILGELRKIIELRSRDLVAQPSTLPKEKP